MLKLPLYMHDRWRKSVLKAKDNKIRVTFSDFLTFVKNESENSNDPTFGNTAVSENRQNSDKPPKKVSATDLMSETPKSSDSKMKCVYCDLSSHQFKKLPVTKKCRSRLSFLAVEENIQHYFMMSQRNAILKDQYVPKYNDKTSCFTVPLLADTGAGISDCGDISV